MKNGIPNLSGCKRIAIMGGTFDPIHYGHLVAAEAVLHVYELERVLFIPSGQPPHKDKRSVSGSEQRYLMTLLATMSNPHFQVSRIEIDRPGATYTIDTICALCERYADIKLYFITGADAVHQILTWKDADKLLNKCSFIAVTRPGYNSEALYNYIKDIKQRYSSKIHLLEVPGIAISSSDVRGRVIKGEPIRYLLPNEVEHYIKASGLYNQKNTSDSTLEDIVKFLKKHLGQKRYTHTMSTAAEAVRLAMRYGANPINAYEAALLHDCAKDHPNEEKKKLCKKFGIKPDDIIRKQFDLIHGYLSAEIAHEDFNVTDKDMLNAIRYHTTGRKNMSLMEKIIYIADYIEPNRDYFPGLEQIRDIAYNNLDKAIYLSLKHTINYNRSIERLIHPLSIEALGYYKGAG